MESTMTLVGDPGEWSDIQVVAADRLSTEQLGEVMNTAGARNRLPRKRLTSESTLSARWLEPT